MSSAIVEHCSEMFVFFEGIGII